MPRTKKLFRLTRIRVEEISGVLRAIVPPSIILFIKLDVSVLSAVRGWSTRKYRHSMSGTLNAVARKKVGDKPRK